MDSKPKLDCQRVGRTFNLTTDLTQKVADLLVGGFEPAYIARHHHQELPGVSDWQIFGVKRAISEELKLERRRQSLVSFLKSAERLTPEVQSRIDAARTTHQVDVLQAIWKRRKSNHSGPNIEKLNEIAERAIAGELDEDAISAELANLNTVTEATAAEVTVAEVTAEVPQQNESSRDEATAQATPDSADPPTESASEVADAVVDGSALSSPELESSAQQRASESSPQAERQKLRELIKHHLRSRVDIYDTVAKVLRTQGRVISRTSPVSNDEPEETVQIEPTAVVEAQPFAEGILPEGAVGSEAAEAESDQPKATVEVVDVLASASSTDAADIRRRRRKESRKRRRAHLETMFRDFADAKIPVGKILPWQYLMIDHADRLRILELVIEAPSAAKINAEVQQAIQPAIKEGGIVSECLHETLVHDVLPELKRLLRKDLCSRAQSHAAKYATLRIRELLQAPAHPVRVLAVDIIGKSDAELAVLERNGEVILAKSTNLGDNADQRDAAMAELKQLVEEHNVQLIAVGEGNRGRAYETMLASLVADSPSLGYVFINREGTEHYATSPLGSRELPQQSAKSRSAVCLGRRLQDPFNEFGKIDPRHVVAASWPIIPDDAMNERLGDAVASCVGRLGVDLNQATETLLAHVPGISEALAKQIVASRRSDGLFKSKSDLRRIEAISDAAFERAAGFLRVAADDPLDNSLIAPSDFATATSIIEAAGLTPSCLAATSASPTGDQAIQSLSAVDAKNLASKLDVDAATVVQVLGLLKASILARRETDKDHAVQLGTLSFEGLKPEDELLGTVSKVVSFGIFIDLGCGLTGLCHISQMGSNIRDAREQFTVGDLKRVEIVSLDSEQRHIALRLAGTQSRPPAQKRDSRPAKRGGGKGKRDRSQGRQRGPRKPVEVTAKAKKRKAPPITDAMKKGSEPMRTFGDLKQFFDQDDGKSND